MKNDASKHSAHAKSKCYNEEYILFLEIKIENAMRDYSLYLQKDFNLQQLSVFIQIPTHHLTYYFTSFKQQSFNDYRNEFRIQHAKLLIMQEQSENFSLEAIGLKSGFTNRNSFAKAFKDIEGVTPRIFATQNKKTTYIKVRIYLEPLKHSIVCIDLRKSLQSFLPISLKIQCILCFATSIFMQ